jgi:hypothetical protein
MSCQQSLAAPTISSAIKEQLGLEVKHSLTDATLLPPTRFAEAVIRDGMKRVHTS